MMTETIRCIIIPLFIISFAAGKAITADVTGDGVSDQITMGLKTVYYLIRHFTLPVMK